MDVVIPSGIELGLGFLAFVAFVILIAAVVSWDLHRIGVSYWWAIGLLALAAWPLGLLGWVLVRVVERRSSRRDTSSA